MRSHPTRRTRLWLGCARDPPFACWLEQRSCGCLEREFLPLYTPTGEIEAGPLEQFLDRPTARVVAGKRAEPPADLAARARELLAGLAEVSCCPAGLRVAVANTHPVVLAVADEVTARNDEEGVARVLERLLG